MKSFIALCLVVAVASAQTLTAEQTQKLKEHYKVCFESSQVDKALIAKARSGEFDNDSHLYEFFDCMFKRTGFLNNQGQLQTDVIKSKVPSGLSSTDVDSVVKACAHVTSVPKEKIALETYKCYLTESPVKIHLIAEA